MTAGLLLDTHVFIWWATGGGRVSARARAAIADPETPIVLSVVVPWEMTIKAVLGRLDLATSPRAIAHVQVARHGYHVLEVGLEHVLGVADLPPHHGDPFDRLLIAQARADDLTVITADGVFTRYDVPVLW